MKKVMETTMIKHNGTVSEVAGTVQVLVAAMDARGGERAPCDERRT